MASRYDTRSIFINDFPLYNDYMINRGTGGSIKQFVSPQFPQMAQRVYDNLSMSEDLWTTGDRLCKLAGKYYGNSQYWWVIAYFNNKPTDAHFKIGDVVYIPTSLEKALEVIGR